LNLSANPRPLSSANLSVETLKEQDSANGTYKDRDTVNSEETKSGDATGRNSKGVQHNAGDHTQMVEEVTRLGLRDTESKERARANQAMNTEASFRALHAGDILHEFSANGMVYILYRHAGFDELFITGAQFEWKFGIVWSKEHRCAVEKYFVAEDVRRAIERFIMK
jgi:hypothetical protein